MRIYTVDAFTGEAPGGAPALGNPAAVCILERRADDAWMQLVASEMNLSETAFVEDIGERFGLRWFTPRVEVDLCGHATLASAHVLWSEGFVEPKRRIEFDTRSGTLAAVRDGDWIELDFPAQPPAESPPPHGLLEALDLRALGDGPLYVGRTRFDYFVEMGSEENLKGTMPDFALLRGVPCRGVILTCRSAAKGFDFASRFFAPSVGIDEDPVTGSAHCSLGPYWSGKTGKRDFIAYQASERGGVLRVGVRGDRTAIAGRAVTFSRGDLLHPLK